jgi:hypothetical protein
MSWSLQPCFSGEEYSTSSSLDLGHMQLTLLASTSADPMCVRRNGYTAKCLVRPVASEFHSSDGLSNSLSSSQWTQSAGYVTYMSSPHVPMRPLQIQLVRFRRYAGLPANKISGSYHPASRIIPEAHHLNNHSQPMTTVVVEVDLTVALWDFLKMLLAEWRRVVCSRRGFTNWGRDVVMLLLQGLPFSNVTHARIHQQEGCANRPSRGGGV